MAAWGEALGCDAPHLAAAKPWCSTIFEQWQGAWPSPALDRLPAVLVASTFDAATPRADASWREWPRASLWIPRFIAFFWPGHTPERGFLVHGPDEPLSSDAPYSGNARRYRRLDDHAEHRRYVKDVRAAVNEIAGGRIHKLVLARRAVLAADEGARFDAAHTLAALADGAGQVSFGLMRAGEGFVGSTPEVLARVDGGILETHALAGTARLGEDVLASDKNRREHRLVLDALAFGLSRLCTEVEVEPAAAAPAGEVEHIEARLTGRLRAGVGVLDAALALHPTPALAGAPTAAAIDWLRAHEPFDRGHYGGPIGWLSPSGNGVIAVGIRSALIGRTRATLYAGAGVVAGSDPEAEWNETESKLATMLRAIRTVEEGTP
jgi:isochorismate synthase